MISASFILLFAFVRLRRRPTGTYQKAKNKISIDLLVTAIFTYAYKK